MLPSLLKKAGWQDAAMESIGGDAASRCYTRLRRGSDTAILMEQVASIPGHNIEDYLRIGEYLHSIGIRTPQVYESDLEGGLLLLEDFGDISFKQKLSSRRKPESCDVMPEDPGFRRDDVVEELYTLATDVLIHLRDHAVLDGLPDYYDSHVHKGRQRVVDWYIPLVRSTKNPDGLAEEYLAVWDTIEQSLPPCPQGFLHIDYHVENLMWLPEAEGLSRAGILDFQGAMVGPLPYDLVNLLEDARFDIAPDLRATMIDRYCVRMTATERDVFENWYRVLGTQFHCRLIGQFIKLALKEKPRYLDFIPRLTGYLQEGLKHPVLEPLQAWFQEQNIDFSYIPNSANIDESLSFIRSDAF